LAIADLLLALCRMAKWPPTGRPEITILKGDYHRTTHKDEYLNDTIIDWAIRFVPASP
jgi:Ulp1 family protease